MLVNITWTKATLMIMITWTKATLMIMITARCGTFGGKSDDLKEDLREV